MTYEEFVKLLAENLTIEIDQIQEFEPIETIRVKLLLFNKVISESSCVLPKVD